MSTLDLGHSLLIVEAWEAAARNVHAQIHASAADAAQEVMRPSAIYRPRVSIDGDKWCALYGDNLQDGVAGFGDSPAEAMADFDDRWRATLPQKVTP